jgi:hemoglobin
MKEKEKGVNMTAINVVRRNRFVVAGLLIVACALPLASTGCGGGQAKEGSTGFFTSGSREADQRAEQRMAKTKQIRGEGEQEGEKALAKVKTQDGKTVVKAEAEKSLYDRLGGEATLKAIVDDFVPRVLADPRVNWERKGVKYGGLGINRNKSVQWDANEYNVAQMKKHLVQFLSLSTGGPPHYDGLDMKAAHANKHITNAEFDASVGDFKASLDKLQIPNKEQKELLAIVESTRPQVVEER